MEGEDRAFGILDPPNHDLKIIQMQSLARKKNALIPGSVQG